MFDQPAVHHHGGTVIFVFPPNFLHKLHQRRRLGGDSVIWPTRVVEVLQLVWTKVRLRVLQHVVHNMQCTYTPKNVYIRGL